MDGPRAYYAKRIKSEKDKHHMISLIRGIEEIKQMSTGNKREGQTTKQTLNYREETDGYQIPGTRLPEFRGVGETGDGDEGGHLS